MSSMEEKSETLGKVAGDPSSLTVASYLDRFLRAATSVDDAHQSVSDASSIDKNIKFSKDSAVQGWTDPDGTVHIIS